MQSIRESTAKPIKMMTALPPYRPFKFQMAGLLL